MLILPGAARGVLKVFALTVAALFALGVVLTVGSTFFFGSSKVRPLFGASVNSLGLELDAGAP